LYPALAARNESVVEVPQTSAVVPVDRFQEYESLPKTLYAQVPWQQLIRETTFALRAMQFVHNFNVLKSEQFQDNNHNIPLCSFLRRIVGCNQFLHDLATPAA
jgi:hypothetical protein